MQANAAITKISLPEASAPFTTVLRIVSTEAMVDRNRPHYHPDTIEFCAVLRGQLDWFVGEESYLIRPGEVVVIPAKEVHGAVDSNLQPCEIFAVHLAPEELEPKLAEAACALPVRRVRQPEISALVQRIFEEHLRSSPFRGEIVKSLGALLVASLAELEDGEEERTNSRLIRQAQRALMAKTGLRPTVDEIADRLGVSSVWLHKLFVRETGVSPGDWARSRRLTEAKRMLEEGEQSTFAIAMDLGYASGQSFATAFRKQYGMTPSEYRSLHADTEPERAKTIYRVGMRETWVDHVLIYPPFE